jgi:hypothetical protein
MIANQLYQIGESDCAAAAAATMLRQRNSQTCDMKSTLAAAMPSARGVLLARGGQSATRRAG